MPNDMNSEKAGKIKSSFSRIRQFVSDSIKNEFIFGNLLRLIQKHQFLFLFIVVFLIYNLNFRNINSIDTIPASLLPFTLLDSHSFQLDIFSSFILGDNRGAFYNVDNHIYSAYPVVTPVLVSPLYILPYLVLSYLHIPMDMSNSIFFLTVFAMEKIAASFISSLTIVFFYAGLKEIINRRIALVTSLVLAFGTNMWSICSQALWQHGMVTLLFSIMFYVIILNEKQEIWRNYLVLGICSSLLVFNRPSDAFLVLPIVVYVCCKTPRSLGIFSLSAIISSTPLLYYNISIFHSIFGGYSSMASGSGFGFELISPSLGSEILIQSAGLLFSPQLGLLIFTPVALLALFGVFKIYSVQEKALRSFLYSFVVVFILETLVFALWFWNFHRYAGSEPGIMFGPRYFSGFLPAMCILIGIFLNSLLHRESPNKKKPTLKEIFILCIVASLVLWSVFAQIVGAFYFPNGNWIEFKKFSIDQAGKIADTPIIKTFNEGPIIVNPVNILQNLIQRNDIIDPTTDFSVKIGTNLDTGWGTLTYAGTQPVRAIGNYSKISVQYMKYSISENNCSFSMVASGDRSPQLLNVFVNKKFVTSFSLSTKQDRFETPVVLKSSLRMGTNTIELKIPTGCPEFPSASNARNTFSETCVNVKSVKISCIRT